MRAAGSGEAAVHQIFARFLRGVKIACIGPVTADTAREMGLRVDAVAESYTIPGLVEAMVNMREAN